MKKFDSINVIPFIDIMLVLLAIVLTTSTFIAKGIIPVELPKASSSKMKKPKFITISIKKDGTMYLDKKKIDINELKNQLSLFPKNSNIALRCDKNAKFQSFVTVMEVVKGLNFNNLSIVTQE